MEMCLLVPILKILYKISSVFQFVRFQTHAEQSLVFISVISYVKRILQSKLKFCKNTKSV